MEQAQPLSSSQPDHDADILQFPVSHREELDPETMSDAECVAHFVDSWLDTDITRSVLAEKIIDDTVQSQGPLHEKLAGIIGASPLMDDYDRMLQDDRIHAMAAYMQATRAYAKDVPLERKAVLRLMSLRAHAINASDDADDKTYDVFTKLVQP